MVRLPFILLLLLACRGPAFTSGAVDNQEYVFVLNSGRSFMRVLPTDWEPRYEGEFMRIDPRHRVMGIDVILIHPRFPIDPHSLEMARVVRKFASRGAPSYYLWVPPGQELHIGDAGHSELVPVGPHTWIRPSEFRLEFRRPVEGQ
jgi:hypothetical protein